MVADSRHCDNTTVIEHAAPNATSNQVFRSVLAGAARGVYQGCIKVGQIAQKTDARQLSRALLLSHRAEIVTKPELEIFADDVKCSHGATAGELDANALFFLRARGIPEAEARTLLIEAFFGEALDKIENARLREAVAKMCMAGSPPMPARPPMSNNLLALKETSHFDVRAIREQFPILSRKIHGKPLVYLDNGASAQKPQIVLDAIMRGYADIYSNVHRGAHFLSGEATVAFEQARETCRAFVNAAKSDEIIFTKGGTEAINLVASSLGADICEGDEIIVSEMEHHSNIVPWNFLRERKGAVLKWAPIRDDGAFDLDAFAACQRAYENRGDHPHVQRAGHADAGRRDYKTGAWRRRQGADRRLSGLCPRIVDVQALDCRFLRLHRPQALRPHRHRLLVRQVRSAQRNAALSGRRRNDRRRLQGQGHLCARRRTGSRRARRRSWKPSGWAPRSTS